jgi:FMN phosphatase YigB (HAD superfamily)
MSHAIVTDFTQIKLPAGIKTILLDLDNTCYQYHPCHQAGLLDIQQAIEEITGPISNFHSLYQEAQKQIKDRISTQAASHSRVLYAQALFELLGRRDGHIYAHTLEEVYWSTFLKTMKKTAGLDDFLADCHKNATTVVVVSDLTTTIQCRKIVELGIAEAIDYLITAEEAGADKPDPKPFLLALEKANSNIESAIVIGDSEDKDIAGAKALGMVSILLQHEATTSQTTI